MSVRAKFYVRSIERTMGSRRKKNPDGTYAKSPEGYDQYESCEMWTIKMSPVFGNNDVNHENTKFWDSSPGGELSLNCVNKAAVEQFELGKEMYLDFTLAPS